MDDGAIQIRGARQNNLANVDVDVPRGRLVAVTGVSGSGKSSLAFDTLFREGQRRFLETLSAYARQFLGRIEKPDVDAVEGLSPAIAVDQRAVQRGPRSTVGTLTEIYDYLRVLFARAGTAHCPEHGVPLAAQTADEVVRAAQSTLSGEKVHVLAPLIRDRKGQHKALFTDLQRKGWVRVRVDGAVHRLEEVPELERYKRHTVDLVVDRLAIQGDATQRLREAVGQAIELGEGDVVFAREGGADRGWSTQRTCSECGLEAPPLEPRLFSFNSPHGACEECEGLGLLRAPTESRVVRDPSLSIRAGALAVTRASGGALLFPRVDFAFLEQVGEAAGFDLDTPWKALGERARNAVLYGTGDARFRDEAKWNGARFKGRASWQRRYRGVIPALRRAWRKGHRRKMVEKLLEESVCSECGGTRLGRFALAVTVGGVRLGDFLASPISGLAALLASLELSRREREIARELLSEIERRVAFLEEVGLTYLSLSRSADSLSGGESQRIRLAAQLGAGLQGVLYVLDEPSIGLHARDHDRLLGALQSLVDAGNTVVVVEHDEATLRAADHLIDVGPGAGRSGGHIVASGPPAEVARADSPTGRLLRGEIEIPTGRAADGGARSGTGEKLVVHDATGFNLKGVDVEFPLGMLVAVTGVSGSGKSTLVEATLRRALLRELGREAPLPEPLGGLEGVQHVDDAVPIDGAPIGRTPRSNPATYTGAFSPIRDLFAKLPESRMRGWAPGRFSFNVAGGRCEACQGAGAQFVELQFLAPVTVPCPECGGHRFQAETLEVRYRGRSIADVLAMTADEASELFADHPKIHRPLAAMCEVGLGYLTLGQPSTTLSGGEAQRVKLAKHLQKGRTKSHCVYLLDEPTTGLHPEDVSRLVRALQRLVDLGHTVIVIEHDLDLVRAADWVIDLGPEGGEAGGEVVVCGTPETVAAHEASYTGRALRELERARRGEGRGPATPRILVTPSRELRVVGARTHNLKDLTVAIPRDALTVVTGPSGSGKSSLCLDTIHAAGRQRFVESLSTYARQFLSSRDKPPVDRIEGLGPSIAVESRSSTGHPRSTVATTTEIHDYLRVLWARAGVRRCPTHGEKLEKSDASSAARRIVQRLEGEKGWIAAPIFGAKGSGVECPGDLAAAFREAARAWIAAGFARVMVDGVERRLEAEMEPPSQGARVDLVIDRLAFGSATRARIAEAVEQAEAIAGGRVSVVVKRAGGGERHEFSTSGACTRCGFRLEEELEPRHFSFNTHAGACPGCDGLGATWQCDPDLLVDHPELPLAPKHVGPPTAIGGKLGRYLTKGKGFYEHLLRTVARSHRIDLGAPFESCTDAQRALLLFGEGAREKYEVVIEKHNERLDLEERFTAEWPGLCGHVEAWHAKAEDPGWRTVLEGFMERRTCRTCRGERLAPAPRHVTVGRKRLPELLAATVDEAVEWLAKLRLGRAEREAIGPVVAELASRVGLIARVGLGYLTLDRTMSTLSGGEARRVRLSAGLGSHLVGVCYVLDEPTVGLHPADIDRLTDALLELRDRGNTVIVVEHDLSVMERADHLVDMGPGAGRFGGEVAAQGTPAEVARSDSLTGRALRGELALEVAGPRAADEGEPERVGIRGARTFNLKGAGFDAEFGRITGVCGPSGSGKSTLVMDTLVPALRGEKPDGRWKRVVGARGGGRRVLVVDATPLGRTPASVPATAVSLMDPLRELFVRTPEARMRGYKRSHFSFNSTKGRCPVCEGKGAEKVEMQFLADLWLTCEECRGARFRPEVLEVRHRGKSIADVLAMSADEAREFLAAQPAAATILGTLCDVGLGYMPLGQSSTTLSAGEAQRVKLAAELLRAGTGERTVVVLDEPTTGLHLSDVGHLARVLRRLADRGDAVVVIEHHLELLAACDRLVELGPGGGAAGGRVIAEGTPRELAADPESVTGPWLAGLARARGRSAAAGGRSTAGAERAAKKRSKRVRAGRKQPAGRTRAEVAP